MDGKRILQFYDKKVCLYELTCIRSFYFCSCNCIGQRVNIGFAGTLAAGLAIAASFGFCSILGISFVSIVGVVPFLVIGML